MIIVVGYFGLLCLVTAFSLQGKMLTNKAYLEFNILGSGCMIFYSFVIGAYPFTFLNVVWILVAMNNFRKLS